MENKILAVFKNIWKVIAVIFSAIAIIAISTVVVLNSVWLYAIMIDKYNLTEVTALSKEALIKNYTGLVNYLQNPFIDKLSFEDFIMSTNGEIHFYEVKRIFIFLIIIAILFIIGVIAWSLLEKYKKRYQNNSLLYILNGASNVLVGFFIGIVILYFVNFSWAFTMFHKIFFRNDYWLFDPVLDPVINALPEGLFMVMGGIILGIIILAVVGIKSMYYRERRIKVNVEQTEHIN